jgi:uncharacterized protein YcaQ
MRVTIGDLRSFAIARSLFPPTTLKRAIDKLGFVQADPIRAPARAQDLTLRHRVKGYRAGDLERRYEALGVAEDVFINYGFVTSALQALMHPRSESRRPADEKRAQLLLEFVRERGTVHPREVNDHFAHGKVTNYWGGSSNATTHLLDAMHYRGLLHVARRERGIRIYTVRQHGPTPLDAAARRQRVDALVDVAVRIYAPVPAASLSVLVRRLRLAAPQWHSDLSSALQRAKQRLSQARIDGIDWYWPADEDVEQPAAPDTVRFLAPFDPVVWDRARFELLWGWAYRFEAYTPVPKRQRGYYALPLLWGDRVIGWGNLSVKNGELGSDVGYVESPPRGRTFKRELEAELGRMRAFLGIDGIA